MVEEVIPWPPGVRTPAVHLDFVPGDAGWRVVLRHPEVQTIVTATAGTPERALINAAGGWAKLNDVTGPALRRFERRVAKILTN